MASIPTSDVFRILATAEEPEAIAFSAEARNACRALGVGRLDVGWLTASRALRESYVARRALLSQRGLDVAGLNALLRHVGRVAPGARIGCFVAHAVEANLVGFFDERRRGLVGWVRVPVDLPQPIAGAVLPDEVTQHEG